jgi:CBS-domain-containing membrane protein
MKARDIMVRNVFSVNPEASVQQAANILFKNRISAAPVVDEHGRLIGIISEGDLMRRVELETDYRRSWWLKIFARKSKETLAIEYRKSHARRVKDVMTRRAGHAASGHSRTARKKSHQTGSNSREQEGDWNCQSCESHSSSGEFPQRK